MKPIYNSILEIKPYKPGEKLSFAGKEIKLSSNENPFGCSDKVKQAVKDNVDKLFRYPDGGMASLRNKIAEVNQLNANRIICGAGSDELIYLIMAAFVAGNNAKTGEQNELLYSEYGFAMYPISALAVGAKPVTAKEDNFTTSVDNILAGITSNTKAIFIANPNNPTGTAIDKREVIRLLDNVPKDVLICLDLAYYEYAVAHDEYDSPYDLVDKYDNLVILRTFSKAYGIPDLRLGWAYSNEAIIDIINRVRGPFNVSGTAQIAGIAALEDDEFIVKSVAYNNKTLVDLRQKFTDIGVKTLPSLANFILLQFKDVTEADKIDAALRNQGITIRHMVSYNMPNAMRMTVGLEEENVKILEIIKENLVL